ncbi:J domain-containing protein [Hirschfeldia incana]|nr:J domain-containing protein [Hirschfeldia incana]
MEKEDLYAVMDLNNECSQGDLRLSYKNLALKWHPDRFSGENEKDKANTKFQSIQKAYSVLSDSNKRMLYDIGAYDSDDDETGMADFINEMVTLMAQTQSTGDETLEEFEKLFEELLMDDVNQFKTPSSFPYAPFSGTLYGDDLSNDDTPNKVNLDSYCCISSGED